MGAHVLECGVRGCVVLLISIVAVSLVSISVGVPISVVAISIVVQSA